MGFTFPNEEEERIPANGKFLWQSTEVENVSELLKKQKTTAKHFHDYEAT